MGLTWDRGCSGLHRTTRRGAGIRPRRTWPRWIDVRRHLARWDLFHGPGGWR